MSAVTPPRHLVVFVREPRLGRVKSRLARGIGALPALTFYRNATARLVRLVARDQRWRCWLAVTPGSALRSRAWDMRLPRLDQGRGDLGARMRRLLRALPPGPAVIIGSDIPEIEPVDVWSAFRALGRSEAVFGPAGDGGFWLVGLRRRPRVPATLFASVRWSSPHALADTRAGLPQGLSVALLGLLDDIDDEAAYRTWRRRAALSRRKRASPGVPGDGA